MVGEWVIIAYWLRIGCVLDWVGWVALGDCWCAGWAVLGVDLWWLKAHAAATRCTQSASLKAARGGSIGQGRRWCRRRLTV